MKGHIRERSPGRWAIVIGVRDPQTGKRKRRWYLFDGRRQVQVRCAELIAELGAGMHVEPSRVTPASFLERWIEHMQGQVTPRTLERYAEIARKNLVPLFGRLALKKLQPADVSSAYTEALASGRRDGGGVSARTLTHMHRVLRQALQQAVQWLLLADHPADLACRK
jgi:Phage integrase, N-terminal SAM-like domain